MDRAEIMMIHQHEQRDAKREETEALIADAIGPDTRFSPSVILTLLEQLGDSESEIVSFRLFFLEPELSGEPFFEFIDVNKVATYRLWDGIWLISVPHDAVRQDWDWFAKQFTGLAGDDWEKYAQAVYQRYGIDPANRGWKLV